VRSPSHVFPLSCCTVPTHMPPHPPSHTPFCRSRDHTPNRSIHTANWCCIQHRIPVPFSPQSTTACSYGPDEALHRAVLEAMKRNTNNNNNSSSFSFFTSATIVITSCAEVTRDRRRRVCHRGTFALLHSVMAIPPLHLQSASFCYDSHSRYWKAKHRDRHTTSLISLFTPLQFGCGRAPAPHLLNM
jgi:hypothetical protein